MKAGALGVARGVLIFAFALALWQAVVWLTGAPHFILPGPVRVARRHVALLDDVVTTGATVEAAARALLAAGAATVDVWCVARAAGR